MTTVIEYPTPKKIPSVLFNRIKALYGHQCILCLAAINNLTQDHWIPLSRGGLNSPSNIVPLCHCCNQRKKNKLPSEIEVPPTSLELILRVTEIVKGW